MNARDLALAVLEDWIADGGPATRYQPNACIAASTEAEAVFAYFGVPARAVACDVTFWNRPGWQQARAKRPVEQWPAEAWSVGCRHDPTATALVDRRDRRGYDGHVIVVVADTILLDLTAVQFQRPDRGILPPPALTFDIDPDPEDRTYLIQSPRFVALYELTEWHTAWRQSIDGRSKPREAGGMIRRLRDRFPRQT